MLKIILQFVCTRVKWFRSLDYCKIFSRDHVFLGQLQWFLAIISHLQFVTEDKVDSETSQNSEILEARVQLF